MSDFGRTPRIGIVTTGCTRMFRLRRRVRSDFAQHDRGELCFCSALPASEGSEWGRLEFTACFPEEKAERAWGEFPESAIFQCQHSRDVSTPRRGFPRVSPLNMAGAEVLDCRPTKSTSRPLSDRDLDASCRTSTKRRENFQRQKASFLRKRLVSNDIRAAAAGMVQ
jgi:hypothetical protein